jgi:outer membrane protein assembly factor BamB
MSPSAVRGVLALLLAAFAGCSKARVLPPTSPFPPIARWEKPLEVSLASAPVTDGTLVFAVLSTGPVLAIDPGTGATRWTRANATPGLLAARPSFLVFVEKGGIVWGLRAEDGSAHWKTTTSVRDVQTVRLDGNRVFLAGATGFAALMVSTGEIRFDLEATNVRDIDAAGDALAAIEAEALVIRDRETGEVKWRVVSPEGSFGAPALFADGRVVVGSGARRVRAVSAKGSFDWRFKVGAVVKDRPLDFQDRKRVGVFSFEGVFYELSLGGGDMRRRALLPSRPYGPPHLAQGRLWLSVFEDEVAALDPKTLKLLGRTRFGGGFLWPPILAQGRLIAEISGPRRLVGIEIANPL